MNKQEITDKINELCKQLETLHYEDEYEKEHRTEKKLAAVKAAREEKEKKEAAIENMRAEDNRKFCHK